MRVRCIFFIMVVIFWSASPSAGQRKKTEKKPSSLKKTEKPQSSIFDKNQFLYFPDYYAFYDPKRGYVFWDLKTQTWISSFEVPAFMSSVDMSKTRIQILDGLSLDLYPELNYPNYMKLYPARQNDPRVPVPNPGPSVR